jgi:hypothetical protein
MGVSIDLRKAHLSRQYGDILAVLSWMNDGRALFLIPALRRRAPWFIVLEQAAHEWNDQDRENFLPKLTGGQRRKLTQFPKAVADAFVAELAQSGLHARASKACEVLGIEASTINVHRVIGIVNDMLPELIRMPSAPPREHHRGSFGYAELRADGELLTGRDITVEDEGAAYG